MTLEDLEEDSPYPEDREFDSGSEPISFDDEPESLDEEEGTYPWSKKEDIAELGPIKPVDDEYDGLDPEDYDLMDDGSMVDPETGKTVWTPTEGRINEEANPDLEEELMSQLD